METLDLRQYMCTVHDGPYSYIHQASENQLIIMFSDFRVADQMGVFKSGTLRMQATCPVSTLGQR